MENLDLYIRDIAASLKALAGKEASTTDLSDVVTKLDAIATKLDAIDGHLNPLYNADYVAPNAES